MSTQKINQSTPTVTSTTDSWESRIQSAATFMGLTVPQVESGLKKLGVEKEPAGLEMLSDETVTLFGDIRSIFCDNNNNNRGYDIVPIAKVRLAMKYLRGPQGSQKTDTLDPEMMALQKKYGFKMKLEDVDPAELLENYHPDQPNHPITVALRNRFGDSKVIVFKPDSKVVDIEATANYFVDLEQGFPEQEAAESDGVLVRIYAIGQVPDQMVEEDPLFEGRPLKRGRSIVNRLNWTDAPLAVKQFCRIVVDRNEVDVNNRYEVQEFMRLAGQGIAELKKFYPEAALEYREKSKNSELPRLTLTMESANSKKQNPFGIGSNKRF